MFYLTRDAVHVLLIAGRIFQMEQVPPAAAASISGASKPPAEAVNRFSTQDRKRAEATKRYLEDKYTKMKIQEKERRDRYLSC